MYRITIIALLLSCVYNYAIGQSWNWAVSGGSTSNDSPAAICTDNVGNVYVTGTVGSSEGVFGTDTVDVQGHDDIFIAKYDLNGNLSWIKVAGSSYFNPGNLKTEIGQNICFDSNSNSIFVTGIFVGNAMFDTIPLNGQGGYDIFIASLDIDGKYNWVKRAGGIGDDYCPGFALTDDSKLLMSGSVKDSAEFGPIKIQNGGYLCRYDKNGTIEWAKQIYNSANNFWGTSGSGVELEVYNNYIYMLGTVYSDTAVIDDSVTIISTGQYPSILARFDSVGKVNFVQEFGRPSANPFCMDIDEKGRIYMGGDFTAGMAIFGADTIVSSGSTDFYLTQFDQHGNYKWVRQCKATSKAIALDCEVDNQGYVYLTGMFEGTGTFGSSIVNAVNIQDIFVARYDSLGGNLGVMHSGSGRGRVITIDTSNSVIVGGTFTNTVSFGSNYVVSRGQNDIFLSQLTAITSTGGGERLGNEELLIYANPSQGICNVVVPEEFIHEKELLLYIYDLSGSIIQQAQILNEDRVRVNIEHEAKGMYHAVLTNGKKQYTGKIIFE